MANLFSLEGKNAWITGASYGIGFNIAKAFVAAGIKTIIFNDINEAALERGLANYKEAGIQNVKGYVCDVTKEDDVKALVEKIQKELESLQGYQPQILIVSPANVREDAEYGPFGHEFSARSYEVSQKLAEEFRTIAEETGSLFFDAAEFIETSPLDGIHLSEESHRVLAHNLYSFLKEQDI